jgi:hypothetical protein
MGALACGVLLAVVVPTALHWKSTSPHRDTLAHVADFSQPSATGRIVQARTSLSLWSEAPWWGVGPGQWRVHYPRVAHSDDPTLKRDSYQPLNRLITNDWIALLVERGLIGLALVGAFLVACAKRRARGQSWLVPTAITVAWVAAGDAFAQTAVGATELALLLALAVSRPTSDASSTGAPTGFQTPVITRAVATAYGAVLVFASGLALWRIEAHLALVRARSHDAVVAVATRHPTHVGVLSHLVERAELRGDRLAATPWLTRLAALRPNDPRVLDAVSWHQRTKPAAPVSVAND